MHRLLIDGPAWTQKGLTLAAGRYPLAVERHVMALADRLVPGVITVTPHARYFSVHAVVADDVARRDLDVDAAYDLIRRVEVAVAAISHIHHGGKPTPLGRAHGADALVSRLASDDIVMTAASQPTPAGYVRNTRGFWAAYAGPEATLGILAGGRRPHPGPLYDETRARPALAELLDLATHDRLAISELSGLGHLCICGAAERPDGDWLSEVLCGHGDAPASARDRRQTIQLIKRIVETHDVARPSRDIAHTLAFGDFLTTDGVASQLPIAMAWRGLVLRNFSVGAWRRLWAWLVAQVEGTVRVDEISGRFASLLPAGTVHEFIASLPSTVTASGAPTPAEDRLRQYNDAENELPGRELGVLAAGVQRLSQLTDRTREAFIGKPGAELGPVWLQHRLDGAAHMPMRDFGRSLVADMISRARRIAMSKTRRRADGTLWMPARLRELDGGWLYKTSDEGSVDVSIRLDQLCSVLAGAGVLTLRSGRWGVSERGHTLLVD